MHLELVKLANYIKNIMEIKNDKIVDLFHMGTCYFSIRRGRQTPRKKFSPLIKYEHWVTLWLAAGSASSTMATIKTRKHLVDRGTSLRGGQAKRI